MPNFLSPDAQDILLKILNTNPEKRYTISEIKKHKWWKLGSYKNSNSSHGIIIGYNRIPVDDSILEAVASLGFDKEFVKKCI